MSELNNGEHGKRSKSYTLTLQSLKREIEADKKIIRDRLERGDIDFLTIQKRVRKLYK